MDKVTREHRDANHVTRERLKELYVYELATGKFLRRQRVNQYPEGSEVRGNRTMYGIRIKIDGMNYVAHRLAFLYVIGIIPDLVVHKNGDKHCNRWDNLKSSTSAALMRKPNRGNK